MTEYNTLAEIQRNCNKIWDSNSLLSIVMPQGLVKLPHPSEKFTIESNGVHYLVNDNGFQSLYKVRNNILNQKAEHEKANNIPAGNVTTGLQAESPELHKQV